MFGEIYEFFLGSFAMEEGQGGGAFYTPASVVKYMVEVLRPVTGDKITFCPPQELIEAFRTDYANMVSAFIFKEAPSFDALMQRTAQLQERFRKM